MSYSTLAQNYAAAQLERPRVDGGALVTVIDQFKHGAFALALLFGHRKQFWLLQQ